MWRGWFSRLLGFGRRFRARGSHRPGRSPTRWYATTLSSAATSPARCWGRAASSFGANAVTACLAPLKLIARLHVALAGGHRHDRPEQVVRQQVRPDLFLDHLRSLAAQDVHLYSRLYGSDIDLPVPPPLEQAADLPAVDRCVEDRRYHLELLGAVALAAGIDGHLAHGQALGVAAVLLARHPARLV